MTPEHILEIGQQAVQVLLFISLPILGAALGAGLLVSIFQAATQINEMTLSFIPKLIAVFITLILAGPWLITVLVDYVQHLYASIPQMM